MDPGNGSGEMVRATTLLIGRTTVSTVKRDEKLLEELYYVERISSVWIWGNSMNPGKW